MKPRSFIPLADPVRENEVSLGLRWRADSGTTRAIKRQAKLMGMSPNDYLRQALAAVIAGNEEATGVSRDGRLACAEFSARALTRPKEIRSPE